MRTSNMQSPVHSRQTEAPGATVVHETRTLSGKEFRKCIANMADFFKAGYELPVLSEFRSTATGFSFTANNEAFTFTAELMLGKQGGAL